eukprot:gene54276-51641_t
MSIVRERCIGWWASFGDRRPPPPAAAAAGCRAPAAKRRAMKERWHSRSSVIDITSNVTCGSAEAAARARDQLRGVVIRFRDGDRYRVGIVDDAQVVWSEGGTDTFLDVFIANEPPFIADERDEVVKCEIDNLQTLSNRIFDEADIPESLVRSLALSQLLAEKRPRN